MQTGHNVIAQLTYFFVLWIGSLFNDFDRTGHAGRNCAGRIPGTLFWLGNSFIRHVFTGQDVPSFGRLAFLLCLSPAHLYLVIRQEILDDDGTISSIFSGYKYVIDEAGASHEKE